MKQMRSAMRIVSAILILAFLSTAGFLTFTVYSQGSRWITTRYNTRLNTAKQKVHMGSITDRDGILLASTDEDGVRSYPANKARRRSMSHVVGDQLSMSGTGVETFHAGTLLGISGSIVDRTWQFITGSSYRGDDIQITVSSELQKYIFEQFPAKKKGSVVIINYKTGEVLSMLSMPYYDPNSLTNRRSSSNDNSAAYLSRSLQGQYTPGSVFKIVTLAAALESIPDVSKRTFHCTGSRTFEHTKVSCIGGTKHGKLGLMEAFAQSCNTTFAELAVEMGEKTLVRKAEQMGLNKNFNFKDLIVYQSRIPTAMEDVGELAWTGVGQGKLLVTPIHMALIAGAVANDGLMREPQLIKQVTSAAGIPRLRTTNNTYGRIMTVGAAKATAQCMAQAVESGTAKQSKIKGFTVCGKTGTAEVSDDKSVQTDAWYVGFVQDENAPYAIAVVVEAGGKGGGIAAPLAQKALKKAIALGL